MFSLPATDPWPADRSCQARLKMFRHREPFVRLAVLKARPPDSTVRDSPRGLIGEFLPLFICCCPRGFAAGVERAMSKREGEWRPSSKVPGRGDLEAQQTLPPPPRYGTENMQDRVETFDVNTRRSEARTRNTTVSSPYGQRRRANATPRPGRPCPRATANACAHANVNVNINLTTAARHDLYLTSSNSLLQITITSTQASNAGLGPRRRTTSDELGCKRAKEYISTSGVGT
ncbi:hypothetical protein L207DRAFT_640602 [Hyaloscypha variabilis F]|uniref:Uncharacterized protein n=1 Tax=Hyaloscypha variabilis (strain UAMH 11265 / GT02V1 / F) TaxID=1149755 RepID=A0A2J6QZU5_HYAVF|nr:hypothetical protein L207DRAFT_640602 [Hyaloscypha variabilis F]